MRNKEMNIKIDKNADAVYVYFQDIKPGSVTKTVVVNDPGSYEMVNLDFDINGILLGIEILGISSAKDDRFK